MATIESRYAEASALYYGKEYGKAFPLLQALAKEGHAHSQVLLGCCYYKGQGTSIDEAKAVEWFHKAAEQKDCEAQGMLGNLYFTGRCGVTQDYEKAVEWLRKAAEQGFAQAQAFLGHCYQNGFGAQEDLAAAVEWYRKAAFKGSAAAKEALDELEREEKI